jgi:hypothetical protein
MHGLAEQILLNGDSLVPIMAQTFQPTLCERIRMKSYRKNPLFVARKMMDQGFLVPVSEDIRDMRKIYRLNDLGWFVWENLEKKNDLKGLSALIAREFTVDDATARRDLSAFLNELFLTGALLRREETGSSGTRR